MSAVCSRCGREFNAWTITLKGTPQGGGATCQKCRNTATRGEKRPAAKLTEYDVQRMREEREAGASIQSLVGKYGVAEHTVRAVCARKAWRHVA